MDYSFLLEHCDDNFILTDIIDNLPSMPDDLKAWVKWNFHEMDKNIYSGNVRRVSKYCTVTKYFKDDMDVRILNDDAPDESNYQAHYCTIMRKIDKMNQDHWFDGNPECYAQLKNIVNAPSYDDDFLYTIEQNCDRLLKFLDDKGYDELEHRIAQFLTSDIMPWKALGHDIYLNLSWKANNGWDSSIDDMYLLYNLSHGLGKIVSFKHLSIADENDIAILVANYFHILKKDNKPCTNRFVAALQPALQSMELVDTIHHCCNSIDTVGLLGNMVYPYKYCFELSNKDKLSDIDTVNGYSIIQHMDSPFVFNKEWLFEATQKLRMINEDEISAYFNDNICGRDIQFTLTANDVGNIRKNTKLSLIATVDMLNDMSTKYLVASEDGKMIFLLFTFKFSTSTPIYGIELTKLPDGSRHILSIQKSYVNTYIHKSGF